MRFKACPKCGGPQSWDDDAWRCWTCGLRVYVGTLGLSKPERVVPEHYDKKRKARMQRSDAHH